MHVDGIEVAGGVQGKRVGAAVAAERPDTFGVAVEIEELKASVAFVEYEKDAVVEGDVAWVGQFAGASAAT